MLLYYIQKNLYLIHNSHSSFHRKMYIRLLVWCHLCKITYKKTSVALVRKRTILTERPPLVGEVSANFCGQRVLRGQRNGYPRSLILVF
jgi:hypothetical protein